jgi:ABC-type Co2+ transport system permease subunit
MHLNIDLTTIVSIAITSIIQGTVTVLVVRYIGKGAEHLEKLSKKNGKKEDNG